MRSEVVKVDAKGRITIPSYVRLLLNVDEGSRVIMDIDELRGIIVLRTIDSEWMRCRGTMTKSEVAELMAGTTVVYSISCSSRDENVGLYECDIIVGSGKGIEKVVSKMKCFSY
mgnify:CR=1 FL=1